MDPDSPLLAEAMARCEEHQAPIRVSYYTLKAKHQIKFRRNLVSPDVVETGKRFAADAEQIRSERNTRTRKIKQAQRAAAELGVAVPSTAADVDELQEGLEWEKELQEQRARRLHNESPTSQPHE
jgi:hypothetical protein